MFGQCCWPIHPPQHLCCFDLSTWSWHLFHSKALTPWNIALDCNKALYGVFAVWKLLWKLTCSIIRNYLEFSASFSFICDSGRNQHVETKNVLSYTAVLSTKITKPYPFNFSKAAAFLNFKFVLWAAKPHDLYLLNYKFTVIYWSTFANFHIYSSVFWSLMMKSALWWINLKPQFLIMF